MKKIIYLITLVIIGTIQLSASVWQRVNGPTESKSVKILFNFNNQIFASSKEGVSVIDDKGNWNLSNKSIFENFDRITVFHQKDNVALIDGWKGNLSVTYDGGDTWSEISNIRNVMDGYEAVVIVGETIFAQEHIHEGPLYKLEKNSEDWEKVYFDKEKKDTIDASKLVSDGNYIFAGSSGKNNNNSNGGITVSSDKGKTWNKLENFNRPVTNMVMHNNKLFVASSDNHIYRTSDKGVTWDVDTTLIMPTDHFLSHNGNLFVAVNNTASIYLADNGLLMSSDDGVTWEKRSEGLYTINLRDIEVKDSKLFVLDDRSTVFESTNEGKEWTKSKLIDSNTYSNTFVEDNDTLYVSGGDGIFYSTDEGINWINKSENLVKASMRLKKIYKNKNIYVGVDQWDLSIIISSDVGDTWQFANINYKQGWVGRVHILEDKIVVTSTFDEFETRFTTDYGTTWEVFDDPVIKKEFRLGEIVREENDNITWFTSGGIFKSTNNGIDWENIGNTNPPSMSPYVVRDEIYYGTDIEYYINKSTDKGLNWERTGYQITDFSSFIFDVVEGNLIIPIINGIKISSDYGETFDEYLIDTTLLTKSDIFGDIIQQGDYLFGTTLEGLWRAKLSDLGIEKITSVESEIENNYLYTYPPYPLPAKSEVKVFFYWDINLPMTVDDISIYDLNGKKIPTTGNLRLEKQASHNGNLIWDCSSAQSGVYIISIKHGTEEKAVKVIVE